MILYDVNVSSIQTYGMYFEPDIEARFLTASEDWFEVEEDSEHHKVLKGSAFAFAHYGDKFFANSCNSLQVVLDALEKLD
ncbi:hypothetical protein [Microbulbifer sp. VAAF005]|uniref:hypothetical protein n=1 Tax=Microbulbifer sp. VAAF005 TaxID=3034230 RepID=UPI0024AE6251|nr:hypothetical protein [Microbulbifer sp. VAAF005]WHI45686.1 hypothetical protein P0078_18445 [Microbulbifer sp. VAAF005]